MSKNLDDPYTGNTGGTVINEHGQIEKVKGKKKHGNRNDPIKKLFGTNQRVNRFKKIQNKKLCRILERMELDKPILMHDKMEIIWEKSKQRQVEVQMKLNKNLTETERFNFNNKRKSENQDHSVNRFLVKQNLEKLKQNRMMGNKNQIKAYNRML